MALTQNTYVGDGTTVLFSFTFPYLDTTDIKVSVNGTTTTAYTLDNATTVRFNTAPANGAQVRIYRKTNNEILQAEFYPGSAIRAQDLNDDFTQILYATQEAVVTVDTSEAKSEAAMLAAGAAVVTADEAKATAEGAALISGVAIQKADTAVADSASATSTANQADTKATSALAAVSNAVRYTVVQNVAAIPSSPANETYIEVVDATGIESFSPLTDIPNGFIGDSGLTVRLRYTTTGNTWRWLGYTANNSDSRYITEVKADSRYQDKAGMSSYLTTANAASTYQDKAGMSSYLQTSSVGSTVQPYDASTAKLNLTQSFTKAQRGAPVALTDSATITPDFSLSNNFTLSLGGSRTLANPTGLVAGQSGCIVITNGGSNTLVYGNAWKFPGGTAPAVTANGVDVLAYYVESATRITARMVGDVK